MLKMADACQEANKHKQATFQEMYVQRHNNVRYVIKIYSHFFDCYETNLYTIFFLIGIIHKCHFPL